jgi:methionine sulfoxide reductase catalytic subunit
MLVRRRRGWELPESAATPEPLFHQRRQLIQGLAVGPILLAGGGGWWRAATAAEDADPTADLYPVQRNPRYRLDERIPDLSDKRLVTTYNNFYEFGSHKQIWQAAQALEIRP